MKKSKIGLKLSRQALIGIVLISVLSVGAMGAYLLHYMLTTPATVSITTNTFEIQLFSDIGLTTHANTIAFPNIMQSRAGGNSATSPSYWIYSPSRLNGQEIDVKWTTTDLNTNFTVTAEYYNTGWATWTETTQPITLDNTYGTIQIRFTLDVDQHPIGNYAFNIELQAGDET